MLRRLPTRDELATELMPAVVVAAGNIVRQQPDRANEYDDLISEGFVALARIINRMVEGWSPQEPSKYAYTVCRNAMLDYLRGPRGQHAYTRSVVEAPGRMPEAALIQETAETLEELAACCKDDIDRQILDRRHDGQTMEEVAAALTLHKSNVCRRLAAIHQRYIERNS